MLTDAKVRAARPREHGYRLQDADDLHLYVSPTGARSWRWRRQRDGKEQLTTLGTYRSSFATIMADARPADAAIIDLMLAHRPKDAVAAAYNRASYSSVRREIAQKWADLLLDGFPTPEELVSLPGGERLSRLFSWCSHASLSECPKATASPAPNPRR